MLLFPVQYCCAPVDTRLAQAHNRGGGQEVAPSHEAPPHGGPPKPGGVSCPPALTSSPFGAMLPLLGGASP